MTLEPIGEYVGGARHPYDAARQAGCAASADGGVVLLHPGRNFEQALQDLGGFSRVWLVYLFHHNPNWKPLVQPPRADRKVGVFASRAPYRPNPIGISCVPLLGVEALRVSVGPNDLLDGTPILDIKPYLPYADSFPDAACGWVDDLESTPWSVRFTPAAEARAAWIEVRGGGRLRAFLARQLRDRPTDTARKRVRATGCGAWEIAYRTWRASFTLDEAAREIAVTAIASGYAPADLAENTPDPHGDKAIHRAFTPLFGDA